MREVAQLWSTAAKVFRVFYEVGITNAVRCFVARRRYERLRMQFGFDPWHVSATYWCRRYKREAVRLANSIGPASVCEVGCGLGEIVARVTAVQRYGLDADGHVVSAAKKLNPKVVFTCGTVHDIVKLGSNPVDLVIALNWLHGLDAKEFLDLFGAHLQSGAIRYLLLDELTHPVFPQVKHDFRLTLRGLADVVATSTADSARRLVLIRVRAMSDKDGAKPMADETLPHKTIHSPSTN